MRRPKTGKMKTATMLNKKIVEIARVTSSSSALMTGATAAIADPPQIDVPTPIRTVVFPFSFSSLPAAKAMRKTDKKVKSITRSETLPTLITLNKFISNPRSMIEYCNNFFDVNFIPSVKEYFFPNFNFVNFGNNEETMIPITIAMTGPPIIENVLPKKNAGIEIARHNKIPNIFPME